MSKPDTAPGDTNSILVHLALSVVLGVIGFGFFLGLLWVFGLLLSIPNLVSGILDWLEKKLELVSLAQNFCSDKEDCPLAAFVKEMLWLSGLLIFVALAWKTGIARKAQRLFFLPFDLRTLRPINRYTGMLAFHPEATVINSRHTAELSQAQAWNILLRAVTKDIGDGRWRAFWRRPKLPQPFGWMVLAGPTGVGKTQLALELGRHLARRKVLGNAGRDLPPSRRLSHAKIHFVTWCRRLAWGISRSEDDAWDAGVLPRGDSARIAKLKSWQPRRPTLIVLDDPGPGECSQIVTTLIQRAEDFWHPVRLLIVDQACPTCLFAPDGDLLKTRACEVVAIGDSRFSADHIQNLRPLAKDGTVGQGPLKTLSVDTLEHLLSVTKGIPLFVGWAVHWLVAGNDIAQLTLSRLQTGADDFINNAFPTHATTEGVRRLLQERVRELGQVFEESEFDDDNHLLALGCATIAGSLTITEKVRNHFPLRYTLDRAQMCFPYVPPNELKEKLPGVRPKLVGDVFITHYILGRLIGNRKERLTELLRLSWVFEPEGTTKALFRLAEGQGELSDGFRQLSSNTDPALRQSLVNPFVEASIRFSLPVYHLTCMDLEGVNVGAVEAAVKDHLRSDEANALRAVTIYLRFAAHRCRENRMFSLDECHEHLSWLRHSLSEIRWRGARSAADAEEFLKWFRVCMERLDYASLALEDIHRSIVEQLPFDALGASCLAALVDIVNKVPNGQDN